jgi:multimeric flavodoxin WrbA
VALKTDAKETTMKALAVNGSPRKTWNTAQLLEQALAGAASKGAETELAHLYDLAYTGCTSCFSCKHLGGKSYGRCAVQDGLAPLLEKAAAADVLILGSPIYFGTESGMMRSFLERLLFPFVTYTPGYASIFPGKLRSALIYTMNISEEALANNSQAKLMERTESYMLRTFGNCETLMVCDTYQFTDYSKFLSTVWDPAAKAKRREEVFPKDLEKAFALGARLALAAGN